VASSRTEPLVYSCITPVNCTIDFKNLGIFYLSLQLLLTKVRLLMSKN
jgi:hypothetical protein